MKFKLDISNWGIYKRLKNLDLHKPIALVKSMNRRGKLALGCAALLLAAIPLHLLITGGKGISPTNDPTSATYTLQSSELSQGSPTDAGDNADGGTLPGAKANAGAGATDAPADTEGQAQAPANTATDAAQPDVRLEEAIREAADAANIQEAGANLFGSAESADALNSGSHIPTGGTALSQALDSLNNVLNNMPTDVAPTDQQEVASIKSETPSEGGSESEQTTVSRISDIQQQLENISKLVSGESATGSVDAKLPEKPTATDDGTQAALKSNSEPTPAPTATPQPTPAPTPGSASIQANAHEDELPSEEPDQDIEDETAMITLDIVAIPPAELPATASEESASIEAFIEVALAQVGKPYSTGGKGPDRFDCSGFVFYSLNTSGYSLEYMTSGTWAGADFTTINSIDEMKRGDIICLRGHVAIYLGDGVMVDASSKNGKIVVRDVGGWCRRNFRNAKRIWNLPAESVVTDVKPKDVIELNIVE